MALPKDLQDKWDEACETGEPVKLGELVVCDICNEDKSDSPESGGFIFGSYAYCPKCAEGHIAGIKSYNEEHMIRARCPEGVSFADFVRQYRGPDASIHVQRSEPAA